MPSLLICLAALLVVSSLSLQVNAFGAGNIPSFAALEGKAFRHGDITDILAELAKKSGGAASFMSMLGAGKFGGLDIKRVYFGNWLRDYSQAMDVAGLSKLSVQAIINVVMLLGFLAHGYATGEFEVTEARLGVYLPIEHIDNPRGYNENKDARHVHPRLRGPISPDELGIDPNTGMKNYIANERGNWATSSGLVRSLIVNCINEGRRSRQTGQDQGLYEAYRLLGTFLHTLEDFSAHSNVCELYLIKMGHGNVFPHVGSNARIQSPSGWCPVLTTGTFGGADFMHSVLGEAKDKISEASVNELKREANEANRNPGSTATLRNLLSQMPGGGQQLTREMDDISQQSRAIDPNQLSPQELHATLFKILAFRDKVCMAIESGIEKVPGLGALLEKITNAINKFVFTQIGPYLDPVTSQATAVLSQGSQAVINNEDQFAVFNDPNASDPTHSMLAKDHFANILNEPAGRIAQTIVKFTVNLVVRAWDDQGVDPNSVASEVLQALHHPFFANGRSQIQREMQDTMQKWFSEQDQRYVLNALTADAVRAHKNVRKGATMESHGGCGHGPSQSHQSQSFIPGPEQLMGKFQGMANSYAQQIPGYSTFQNLAQQTGGRRDMDQSNLSYGAAPIADPQYGASTGQHQSHGAVSQYYSGDQSYQQDVQPPSQQQYGGFPQADAGFGFPQPDPVQNPYPAYQGQQYPGHQQPPYQGRPGWQ